ncbi:BamA/TamA family outer membrane protein [Dysgonomonas sp. ZJ279]|uniref:translocation and assembly module lipoprotein TamL n=1 Tax=Dysgonomonas sp. ZJ279 TaxID=2709796 RepID=UPI0013EC5A0F|nr:BamA/TamA family outer membrane protein [Dysgonomonas sp. ZJ279]
MRGLRLLLCIFLILIIAACSTTKNIPEGEYLLDAINIKHDTKNATSDLESFVRQQPNGSLPLFGKVRLNIYNMAGQDTSKWITRAVRKMGQAPVIYSARSAASSATQLQKEMSNQGYLNAEVDTALRAKGKKMTVTYNIKGGTPYLIRNYTYTIEDTTMARIMKIVPLKPYLAKGDFYDMSMLEQERGRVNLIMRNGGYYNFSKEFVYFKADTTLNSHQVDLYMNIYPAKDSLPYPRLRWNKVTIVSGLNSLETPDRPQGGNRRNRKNPYFRNADTTQYNDIWIIRGQNKFLRSTSIRRNNYIKKGALYSDRALTKTYESFNQMSAIKQVNISTTPSSEDSTHLLDATILLTPANAHWFKASLDGTNSAGDIGVAPSLSYQHQNLFNGSEQLSIKLKGAYEFISGGNEDDLLNQSFYEYGIETGVTFPLFLVPFLKKSWREMPTATTRFSVGLNNQHRPEYTREFFNMTVNYGWSSNNNRLLHSVDLFDINYVRMPWVSARFDSLFLNNVNNPLLRESYKDQFISRTSYSFTLVNGRRFNPLYPTYSIRGSLEVAGVLPRLIAAMNGDSPGENGQRNIFGVAYAEYIKGHIDYARTFYFSKRHSLAYHVGLGLAHPYGNSNILPFERRFFSGGANSVRGWNTRRLGPGSYRGNNNSEDFVNQVGDMKLDISIENRHKVNSLLELAEFIDAGNIWTLKKYEAQGGGQFQFSNFYREIAVAYGAGIRFDLGFLLLRLDCGVRAYDPGLPQSDRFVLFQPRLSRMALHFGIGYPF